MRTQLPYERERLRSTRSTSSGLARRAGISAFVGAVVVLALSGCVAPARFSAAPAASVATPAPGAPDLTGSSVLRTVPYKQLAIGDCTDVSAHSKVSETVQILDCASPHASEVFMTINFPDVTTPKPGSLQAVAEDVCGAYTDPLPASITPIWVGPTTAEWATGTRFGLCLAVDSANHALTEPLSQLEGGAAPAAPAAPAPPSTTYLRDLAFGFAVGLLPALALGALFVLAFYMVWSLALTSLFRKVGIPVWKAWVPYVQTWTLLRLGGQNGNWLWLMFVPYGGIVTSVFMYIGMHRIGIAFGKDSGTLVLGIFLPFVWAFTLGRTNEVYRPEALAWHGYPPPLEGYGSITSASA
ncbi:DUF5684 domain-containing protein [Diaminobutyricibacter sp. McL0608]|uniref:DUF5684 domain-containing protein n=1 Tax=Leifsonia sp. McL0608 TaxID=3143537 RepID=UPI0031F31BAC